jgi:hypothetical protein
MLRFFEDLKNIGIRDIVVADDIFLVCVFLIIPFGILLLLFTYIYNKIYIKKIREIFWFFSLEREVGKAFLELEEIWLWLLIGF